MDGLSFLLAGAEYAARIRIPHAAMQSFLFGRSKGIERNARDIASQTYQHAYSLGVFAFAYKIILALLKGRSEAGRRLQSGKPSSRPHAPWHSLVAGGLGGWFVWGQHSRVNEQVVLYLIGRCLFSVVKLLKEKRDKTPSNNDNKTDTHLAYKVISCVTWALSMYMFEEHEEILPRGLKKSMDEIYRIDEEDERRRISPLP